MSFNTAMKHAQNICCHRLDKNGLQFWLDFSSKYTFWSNPPTLHLEIADGYIFRLYNTGKMSDKWIGIDTAFIYLFILFYNRTQPFNLVLQLQEYTLTQKLIVDKILRSPWLINAIS